MYNRYIPQPDGTYQRSRIVNPNRPTERRSPAVPPPPAPQAPEKQVSCSNHCPRTKEVRIPVPAARTAANRDSSVSRFLKQILPKEFDVEDLLVVVLLLLMTGDSQEEQNTALLTLLLYLFL